MFPDLLRTKKAIIFIVLLLIAFTFTVTLDLAVEDQSQSSTIDKTKKAVEDQLQSSSKSTIDKTKNDKSEIKVTPRFIFGHSTGHSGTGSFQEALLEPGCPWETAVDAFENLVIGEEFWPHDSDCKLTWTKVVPHIFSTIHNETSEAHHGEDAYQKQHGNDAMEVNATYVDLGHFHNRGKTIECLAKYFGEEAAFVHIRRNRYSIARSFLGKKQSKKTPCIVDSLMYGAETPFIRKNKRGQFRNTTKIHPGVATCPRSGENVGPVNLPVPSDAIWDAFTPFQRFLWYADEMEHRWHSLTANSFETIEIPGEKRHRRGRPSFHDTTWNSGVEIEREIRSLRKDLGCSPPKIIQNNHTHIRHEKKALNCTEEVWQDLEYRKLMKYDASTINILVSRRFPQHVDSKECIETPRELEHNIQACAASLGIVVDMHEWVLAKNDTNDVDHLLYL